MDKEHVFFLKTMPNTGTGTGKKAGKSYRNFYA